MTIKEYLEKSGRTAAKKEFDFDGAFTNGQQVLHQSMDVVYAGTVGDLMKRSLFYSDKKIQERADKAKEMSVGLYKGLQEKSDIVIPSEMTDLFHAMFGMASETGEIAEELLNAVLEGRPVDAENLIEEIGDQMWYQSLMIRKLNEVFGIEMDFEKIAQKNIDKLKARYPDKFTEEAALNRDLNEEKRALAG